MTTTKERRDTWLAGQLRTFALEPVSPRYPTYADLARETGIPLEELFSEDVKCDCGHRLDDHGNAWLRIIDEQCPTCNHVKSAHSEIVARPCCGPQPRTLTATTRTPCKKKCQDFIVTRDPAKIKHS